MCLIQSLEATDEEEEEGEEDESQPEIGDIPEANVQRTIIAIHKTTVEGQDIIITGAKPNCE